jgi:hypothetical protein
LLKIKVMSEMFDKLKAFLDSPEGQKSLDDFANKLKREAEHKDRWVERMWDRIKDDIDGSIEHLLKWYESDKYRDREYKMGFEPREDLLWLLLDIAEKYGQECTQEQVNTYANMFTGDIYVLGSYIIQVMHGQGSVIRIDKIK